MSDPMQPGKRHFFFRPMLVPSLVALAVLPVLLGLGSWQLSRLHWKEALIATVEARLQTAPAPLPPATAWSGLDLESWEFRPVEIRGQFDPEVEFHYFTQADDGTPGYAVISPFYLEAGGVVLVDKGYVTLDRKDPATRMAGQVSEPLNIIAILRAPQPRGMFDGEDDLQKNVWFVRDPAKMATSAGLQDAAPFLANLQSPAAPGGWPRPRGATVQLRNNHLQYAITWYGLALVFLPIYLIYHINNRRLGFARR